MAKNRKRRKRNPYHPHQSKGIYTKLGGPCKVEHPRKPVPVARSVPD